jgi:two-component system chemotaxis response regulator CheB
MSPGASSSTSGGSQRGPYRIMVVDDSAVVRGMTTRFIEEDSELQVVGSAGNGQRAIEMLDRCDPEVVVLDIEMPVMDGLTALPKIFEKRPKIQVIMSSTLTKANADVTIRALSAGAADYVTKPSNRGLGSENDFQNEIRTKVKGLAAAVRRGGGGAPATRRAPSDSPSRPGSTGRESASQRTSQPARPAASASPSRGTAAADAAPAEPKGGGSADVSLRRMPSHPPQVVAIGSSTGGPQALFEVISSLGTIKQPVLITQHMPATFTSLLADHIARQTSMPCTEARDGDRLKDGQIYIAPGGYHLIASKDNAGVKLSLSDAAPENFCRPSVDPMLRSLIDVYDGRCLAVILTGMGSDGLKGCEALVKAGGHVIAQDEESSVVWGMPGAVAKAGLASAVLPIKDIASQLRQITMRSAA